MANETITGPAGKRALAPDWLLWPIAAGVGGALVGFVASLVWSPLGPATAALTTTIALLFVLWPLRHLSALRDYLAALKRGDLAPPPAEMAGDAALTVAALGKAWQRALTLEQTCRGVSGVLRELAGALEPALRSVRGLTDTDRLRSAAAIRVLETTRAQLGSLQTKLDDMARSAEESQASALQLDSTNRAVIENVQQLAASIDETAASIEEMTYSIKEVARNIEELSLAAEQTATSMNQMDSSISEVETNVKIAAQLAEEVAHDANKGAESVQRTLQGIDKISATVTTAAGVISNLGDRIREIGNILGVIEDVAEQTNLLALNAAIIAAQAGEHGRGFAVVADEIKELADKTGASTKEIAALIRGIQEESHNAVQAIAVGERNVQDGVALSREAEQALAKILGSADKSTQRFKAIAAATVEQARGSKIVADAVERIARSVQQVAAATSEQARGSEQLMRGAERAKGITQHVEHTSHEQGQGSQHILQFVEKLGVQLQELRSTEDRDRQAQLDALNQLDAVRQRVELPEAQLQAVTEATTRLRAEADRLATAAVQQVSLTPRPANQPSQLPRPV